MGRILMLAWADVESAIKTVFPSAENMSIIWLPDTRELVPDQKFNMSISEIRMSGFTCNGFRYSEIVDVSDTLDNLCTYAGVDRVLGLSATLGEDYYLSEVFCKGPQTDKEGVYHGKEVAVFMARKSEEDQ